MKIGRRVGGHASGSGYADTNAVLRGANTDRQRRTVEPEDIPDGNLAGQEDDANKPLLDQTLSDIDILDVVTIFSLAQLNEVYPRLEGLEDKDFSNILGQDNIFQKQTKQILTLWVNRNAAKNATRKVLIKAVKDTTKSLDKPSLSLGKLTKKWADKGLDLDDPLDQVDILDIIEIFPLPELDALYSHLNGIEYTPDIVNIKTTTNTLPTKRQAQDLLHLWVSRNGEAASRTKMIEEIKKCKNLERKLETLTEKWKVPDTQ